MSATINILSVSPDPRFREELETASGSLDDYHVVIHHAGDFHRAVESARSRRPRVAVVEMETDVRPLQAFAEEVAVLSPETSVAGAFRPDYFSAEVSESAIFIDAVRAGVKDFLRRPVAGSELADLLFRLRRSALRPAATLGKIISFVSNKGGVGKSTLAVNAACGLAKRHPGQVLLVDASLQMGVCASLLNMTPAASLTDIARESERLDETLVRQLATPHASGLHLLPAPSSAVEAADFDDEILSRVLTLARHTYKYVLVDTFPMLDRAVVSILDLSDRAYVVIENVVPTLLGGVKFLGVLEGLGVNHERQRIVLNRYTRLPGGISASEFTARFGHKIDHIVRFDNRFVIAANTGEPYVLRSSGLFGRGRELRRLIREIEAMGEDSAAGSQNGAASGRNGEQTGLPMGDVQ
jgi:pilus assembly protein CpaE